MKSASAPLIRDPGAATALLRRSGFLRCTVREEGVAGEVLVIAADPAEVETLAGDRGEALLEALREIGYRYVALDLGPHEPYEPGT